MATSEELKESREERKEIEEKIINEILKMFINEFDEYFKGRFPSIYAIQILNKIISIIEKNALKRPLQTLFKDTNYSEFPNEIELDQNIETVGERITFLRKKLGLTQKEFAEKLCLSPSHICSVENGRDFLSDAIIKLINLIFGIPERWIKDGKAV